jgi:hypothetical protein
MTPPIESVYDDVTALTTQASRRPDNQPPEPLPPAPEDWRATVAEADEHSRKSAEAYQRYICGIERRKLAQSAALRLRRDLSPAGGHRRSKTRLGTSKPKPTSRTGGMLTANTFANATN